jgi:hypothetical protein
MPSLTSLPGSLPLPPQPTERHHYERQSSLFRTNRTTHLHQHCTTVNKLAELVHLARHAAPQHVLDPPKFAEEIIVCKQSKSKSRQWNGSSATKR